jgi:hypothetical protein
MLPLLHPTTIMASYFGPTRSEIFNLKSKYSKPLRVGSSKVIPAKGDNPPVLPVTGLRECTFRLPIVISNRRQHGKTEKLSFQKLESRVCWIY